MELGIPVVVALVLVFIAWKVLKGIVKVGVILLLVAAVVYVLANGGIG